MESSTLPDAEHRVLLLPPTRRDGQITRSLLAENGIPCLVCEGVEELRREIRRGAGAVLLTDEAVSLVSTREFIAVFERQPSWSDLPIVMLVRGGRASPAAAPVLQTLTNVTVLERPAPMHTVLSAVQAAVRGRQWQFRIRDQLHAIETAEAKARHLQEQLSIALEASDLGTFHCGMPLDKIVWNERCKAHFWLPPDAEVNFELFYSIIHPDDRERARQAVHACVYEGQPYDIEYRTVSPEGQVPWVRATGRTFCDEQGKPVRFDGTTQDVTRRKAAEAELLERAEERQALLESERAARAEAERASGMKDEFLATLSHELRTPLNAILGWSQILAGGTRDEADLAEGLRTIERNARAQTQIIEDLLDMSRIISGKIRLDVQRIDLSPVVQSAVETVRPAADAKGVRLQVVLDPLAGPVSGDPNRLQQVLWNLLTNAVKFTPRGGRVQVLLERVNSHLEISVADSGEGIRPEFLPFVFERFRQSDASTTRRHGGLGLGLAIVKQLVELHGGEVRAKSPGPAQGATFVVSLPLTAIRDEPQSPVARRHPSAGGTPVLPEVCLEIAGVKALVVDDEPDTRVLIQRLLEDCDVIVTVAGSAAEAFERVQKEPPDVLVTDIGMPGDDGYSLIRWVRALASDRGGNTPAIALTAYARPEDRLRAIMAGFQHHVAKPVEPAELITMVASLTRPNGLRQGAAGSPDGEPVP